MEERTQGSGLGQAGLSERGRHNCGQGMQEEGEEEEEEVGGSKDAEEQVE